MLEAQKKKNPTSYRLPFGTYVQTERSDPTLTIAKSIENPVAGSRPAAIHSVPVVFPSSGKKTHWFSIINSVSAGCDWVLHIYSSEIRIITRVYDPFNFIVGEEATSCLTRNTQKAICWEFIS